MRIAFVTPEYTSEESYSGGLANYLGRMTTALADHGHDVHVFTKSFVKNEVLDYRGVKVHRVIPLWDKKMRIDRIDRLAPRSLYAPYQDLKAAWSLWRRFKGVHAKSSFDVVQVANVLAVGYFFNRLKDVPVVTRLSSYRPAWDTAAGIELTKAVKWRWWMERKAIQRTQHVYAPTSYVARLTAENYGIPDIDVIETPFYHEEPEIDPTDHDVYCCGKKYLLYFGRMTQMKGVHLLAQVLPRVLQKYENLHAIFIGGEGPSPFGTGMHDYIRAQTEAVADRVTVLGSMRHDRLYPIVQNAHLVVLPSLIDNLPNTCLEAMACSRPVLATTGSCFEQLIEDGHSGFLVSPGDVDSLTNGIVRALRCSDSELQKIGSKARSRIDELHPSRKVPELIAYFQNLMQLSLASERRSRLPDAL
jgi:glycosyltransferase involved in cell wall biosynthesis